jgi:hypothetical protein
VPDQARGVTAAGDPARRPGEHAARGEAHRIVDGREAAVRLDDQDRPAVARLGQARPEAAKIALQHRPDVGVDHRGADPLVLFDLRQHRGRQRHIGRRHGRAQRLGGLPFVPVVTPGVQVADGDGINLGARKLGDRRRKRSLVERHRDAPVGADALAYAQAPVARHQRLWRRLAEIVAVVLEALAHLEDVAVAFGGQQPDARALALEQRIGRHRRAVDDALGVLEQRAEADPERLRQPLQAVHHPKRWIGRGGRRLGERDPARGIERHQVGECAADVDPDAVHGGGSSRPPPSSPGKTEPPSWHARTGLPPFACGRRSRAHRAGRGRLGQWRRSSSVVQDAPQGDMLMQRRGFDPRRHRDDDQGQACPRPRLSVRD